jgi:hypothetical protein
MQSYKFQNISPTGLRGETSLNVANDVEGRGEDIGGYA